MFIDYSSPKEIVQQLLCFITLLQTIARATIKCGALEPQVLHSDIKQELLIITAFFAPKGRCACIVRETKT